MNEAQGGYLVGLFMGFVVGALTTALIVAGC